MKDKPLIVKLAELEPEEIIKTAKNIKKRYKGIFEGLK